jgi:8-oxo-dGTP diphosphatase
MGTNQMILLQTEHGPITIRPFMLSHVPTLTVRGGVPFLLKQARQPVLKQNQGMRRSVQVVHDLVGVICPCDEIETQHRDDTLRWLERTDDVYQRVKPATPNPHLASYAVLIDPADNSTLLVDHILADLWLPPGGHVEPDEHPADAAAREIGEELAIEGVFANYPPRPSFVSVTRTRSGHDDVSLWFIFVGHRDMPLTPDPAEFNEVRWWTPNDVANEHNDRLDPNYRRFVAKVNP